MGITELRGWIFHLLLFPLRKHTSCLQLVGTCPDPIRLYIPNLWLIMVSFLAHLCLMIMVVHSLPGVLRVSYQFLWRVLGYCV